MVYSQIVKYLLSFVIMMSGLIFQANAEQGRLIDETREMQKNLRGSDLGKFLKRRGQDDRNLGMFVNSLHRESMRLSAAIQQDLVKTREAADYEKHYKSKEQKFTALRYCIEVQKYFNNVHIPARINAGAALLYSAAVKKCEQAPLKEFLSKKPEAVKLWRHFNGLVEKSVPIEKTKKVKFQEEYTTFLTAETQKSLGSYRAFPFSKALKPEVVLVADPAKPGMVSEGGLSPLPNKPYKHDQAEWVMITKYGKELLARTAVADEKWSVEPFCGEFIKSKQYQKTPFMTCTSFIARQANKLPDYAKIAFEFRIFGASYVGSADAHAFHKNAAQKPQPKALKLPRGRVSYVVSELDMYRDAITSVSPTALDSCPGTDTAGLKDDLTVAENKTKFLNVTQALYQCVRTLYPKDKAAYSRIFKSLNRYWRGRNKIR